MKKWEALDECRFWFLQNGSKEYDMEDLIEIDDLLAEIKQLLMEMEEGESHAD